MVNLQFYRNTALTNFLNRQIGKRTLEAGILEDRPAALFKRERAGDLAGGKRNKTAGNSKNVTLRQLMMKFEVAYNILLAPWRSPTTREERSVLINELTRDMASRQHNDRRLLNAAQAVIRNPIARGEYGQNTPQTAKAKGFNRLLINTGRFFNTIKVRFK